MSARNQGAGRYHPISSAAADASIEATETGRYTCGWGWQSCRKCIAVTSAGSPRATEPTKSQVVAAGVSASRLENRSAGLWPSPMDRS